MSPPARPLHVLASVIFLIIFSLVTGTQTALLALSPDRLADNGRRWRRAGSTPTAGSSALLSVLVARAEVGLLQEASKDDRLHFLSQPHPTLSVVLSLPSPTVSLLSRMLMGETRCAVDLDSSLGIFWGRVWHGHLVQPTLPILCLTPREWVWVGGSAT